MESASPPHELTTIPEVDTPGTHCYSNSNILSEQEEETHINVFEGLNISQCESDIGSASIKSFDSVSSIPDIDTVLMKRNVITSPFKNRRKRKVMRVLQNKQSQQNFGTGSSNIKSSNQEHLQMSTSSASNNDVSVMTRNLSDDNHVDLENMSMSPVQYISHSLESNNNVNPFTEHNNEVINVENSFNLDVKSVSVDNIMCKEIIEVDNAKQQVSYANHQAGCISKTTFKNNECPFPKEDKCVASLVRKLPFESHIEFSDFVDKRLAKFNEILKDLDEAKEIMSDSTPEDLELAFHRLGVGWAGTTLRKTQEAQELNSGSTSGTNEGIGKPAKLEAKEKNISSNWRKVEEDLTPPNISLRAPILLSASTTNLKKYKT